MRSRSLLPLVALAVLVAGCRGGTDGDTVTVYLRARLGPDGPHGQRAAILTPVERQRRPAMSAARQAVLELLVGPSPDERTRGFQDTIPLATRLLGVTVDGERAVVEFAGVEPDFYGAAAIVYSVIEASGGEARQAPPRRSSVLRPDARGSADSVALARDLPVLERRAVSLPDVADAPPLPRVASGQAS